MTSKVVETFNSFTGEWGQKVFKSDAQKAEWIRSIIALPGDCQFDSRVALFFKEATNFNKNGIYFDSVAHSYDYIRYWDTQRKYIDNGILIDEKYYCTGDFYWYLNFIKIPDKVKNDFAFPRFQDLDYWTYLNVELATLEKKFLVIVKARQTGFTLKFVARMAKRLWFEKGFSGKIAAYEEKYVESAWLDILVPYRNHLNEFTAWHRWFEPSDKIFNWKQGYKVEENGRDILKGNLSSLKGVTTLTKPSAVVSGKTDEILYDEAGLSLNIDKVIQFIKPALKFGDIMTGYCWILGAAGEMKQSERLGKLFYSPVGNNCLSFPNIWSDNPQQNVGMFVPYYYSYGSCIDEFGNSLIGLAKEKYAVEEAEEKTKSFTDYALFKAQYPSTPEEAFSIQEENIFDTEAAKEHFDYLERTYKNTIVSLHLDATRPTGIIHKFDSLTSVVETFPIRKDTDRRGAIVVDEFPPTDPMFGLFYVTIDPIRYVRTDTSESLMSVYVYKAAHRIDNEFTEDKLVAWYCGRHDNPETTYETARRIILWYNARAAIESDQASCIEWMIKKNMGRYLMKRSDIPILKDWVPTSQIHEEYGFRTGSGNTKVKEHLFSLIIEYCKEEFTTEFDSVTGESRPVLGIKRIKDKMLLLEMMKYHKKLNVDRLIAFGAALMVARSNTNRGLIAIKKEQKTLKPPPKLNLSPFLRNQIGVGMPSPLTIYGQIHSSAKHKG